MPDFGSALGDQPGLDEVARTDLLLDALAGREDFALDDPDDDALAALLGDWRDDLRWPPASALVSQDDAVEALIAGISERRRARRGLAAIGSVAATLLLLSGFGAVVADARPGDALYGLHAMMFNEPRVNDDQVVLSAKADLAKVEQMIAQGQWDQAQTQLAEVSSTVQAVNDGGRRQNLLDEVNQLNTKVEKRDRHATLPPNSPPNPALVAPTDSPGNPSTPPAPSVSGPPTSSNAPETTVPTSPVVSATSTSTPPSPTTTGSRSPSSTMRPTPTPTTSPTPAPTPSSTPTPKPTPSSVAPSATPSFTPTSPAAGATSPGPGPGPSPEPSGEPSDASTNPQSPVAQTSGQATP